MRLYPCGLDMRACHPASRCLVTEVLTEGVSTPHLLAFTEGTAIMIRVVGLRNSRLHVQPVGFIYDDPNCEHLTNRDVRCLFSLCATSLELLNRGRFKLSRRRCALPRLTPPRFLGSPTRLKRVGVLSLEHVTNAQSGSNPVSALAVGRVLSKSFSSDAV